MAMDISEVKKMLAVGDTIIFHVDEYHDGRVTQFDSKVEGISERGVDVIYLSGFNSRNDIIPWKDIIAKLDPEKPWVSLENAPFRGQFCVFNDTPYSSEETSDN